MWYNDRMTHTTAPQSAPQVILAPSITGTLVPAVATFNRASGAMWLEYADGRLVHLAREGVHAHPAAATVLAEIGAVRFSDWMLVADRAPMRQARVEVPPGVESRY